MEVQISKEIEFEAIELETARDVVIYSFIVQKSLTYLDLSACEYALTVFRPVFTEEQCRKRMETRRQILYSYHLDLPENLEGSLRSMIPNAEDQRELYEAFHLGLMYVCECVYTRNLVTCVINHIMNSRNQTEKLKRFLNVMRLLKFNESRTTAMTLFDHLLPALYPFCEDSNLVVEFAVTFRFCSWLFHRENPEILEFILFHAMQIRCNICEVAESGLDPINGCIVFRTAGNISTLIAYGTVLRFQLVPYLEVLGKPFGRRIIRRAARKDIPFRRLFLMLQLLCYFLFNHQYWIGLLYIWRSIPDPCLSESEIRSLFGSMISSRRLRYMIEYYKLFIVEETNEMNDEVPRPLQHLCRVIVRSILIRNYQLPSGIGRLGMPLLIRDYLNLNC